MLKLGKIYIDYFYIASVLALGAIFLCFPDKGYEVVVALTVVVGLAVADVLINIEMKGKE